MEEALMNWSGQKVGVILTIHGCGQNSSWVYSKDNSWV